MALRLDHIAILVRDTEQALVYYRDTLGLTVTTSSVIPEKGVRLTHLALSPIELQLVEPLADNKVLNDELNIKGEHLHHLCLQFPTLAQGVCYFSSNSIAFQSLTPHPGVNGKSALFLDKADTRGVLFELTNSPDKQAII